MRLPRLYFWFLFLPVVCFLFSGCKSVVYGSALTSAAVANELIRYTLPELVNIDRIEVTEYHSAAIDSKFLDYYDALIPTSSPYSSTLDDPASYWTVRSAVPAKPKFPSALARSTTNVHVITDPRPVSEFVGLVNANLTLWLNYLDLVPRSPYALPYSYNMSFYSQHVFVRAIGFRNNVLSTTYESKSVIRRLSDADAIALRRVLSSYTDNSGKR